MPKRIRDALIAVTVTGALAGGTAVVAQAASSGSSTTPKAPAAPAAPSKKAQPPAHMRGSGPCPHMGSGSGASAPPNTGSPAPSV
jgi:hypothetical protein